ncbi:hypothetical protein [Plastoroseomonas hellenica]|uniref:hypothetical protein n=1 Tax=Plastoroseomonas hellenica TaxID=2687306 RepID=UPI001BA6AD78|nr:hypothetical protein [Plastoroseomonas hellenica]MBR0643871.1 hypothetical protein [Plastoroseomonas hellenica]
MTDNDSLASSHSDLNSFLFSEVGVDASGRTLSVLSVLARQDLDPWQEAGSLAQLPKPSAAARLARLIAMPASLLPPADASAIAANLVTLLPVRGNAPGPSIMPVPRGATQWVMLALALLAAMLAAFGSRLIG